MMLMYYYTHIMLVNCINDDSESANNNDTYCCTPKQQQMGINLDIVQFFAKTVTQTFQEVIMVELLCNVHSDHLHIVKDLTYEEGCNPSGLDLNEHNETPLHCAAMKGHS